LFEVLGVVEEINFDAITDPTVVVVPGITSVVGDFKQSFIRIYFISYMLSNILGAI
jgi:hypothetical protein